jgi:hypothetical protein
MKIIAVLQGRESWKGFRYLLRGVYSDGNDNVGGDLLSFLVTISIVRSIYLR